MFLVTLYALQYPYRNKYIMTAPFELKMTEQEAFDGLKKQFGTEFTTPEVRAFCVMNDIAYATVTRKIAQYKVGKGKWNLTVTKKDVKNIEKSFSAPSVEPTTTRNLIPNTDDTFVKFGSFNDLKKIIGSKLFYPTFITGLSGNGKTFGVEQACAQLKRELIRVNITIETDEDDLIGGFRLVNGETVWHNGSQSSKHLSEVQSCSLTKSTLHPTRSSAFKASLKELVYFLKRLEEQSTRLQDSTSLPPQILKVRVQTTEDLLELTCSMKPSSKDSQLPSSNPIQNPQ